MSAVNLIRLWRLAETRTLADSGYGYCNSEKVVDAIFNSPREVISANFLLLRFHFTLSFHCPASPSLTRGGVK